MREPLPPERVDETIDYEISDDEVQRLELTPTGDFEVIQHIELPETPVPVSEHRLAVYQSPDGDLYESITAQLQNDPAPSLLHA